MMNNKRQIKGIEYNAVVVPPKHSQHSEDIFELHKVCQVCVDENQRLKEV
jgi:hypothetical protein